MPQHGHRPVAPALVYFLALDAGYELRNRSALEWVLDQYREETQRPQYCREVQHLPLRGLQGGGDRLVGAYDHCEFGDDEGGEGDGGSIS